MVCILILSMDGLFPLFLFSHSLISPNFSLCWSLFLFFSMHVLCFLSFLFLFFVLYCIVFGPITITYLQPAFIKLQTSKTKGTRLVVCLLYIFHSGLCSVAVQKFLNSGLNWNVSAIKCYLLCVQMLSKMNKHTAIE